MTGVRLAQLLELPLRVQLDSLEMRRIKPIKLVQEAAKQDTGVHSSIIELMFVSIFRSRCPSGSTSPRANACGGDALFCPPGSGQPKVVDPGHFASGGTSTTHTHEQPCTALCSYCVGGILLSCSAGTFSNVSGSSNCLPCAPGRVSAAGGRLFVFASFSSLYLQRQHALVAILAALHLEQATWLAQIAPLDQLHVLLV